MSVVKKALDADRPDERLKLVRLLLQAEMYQEAEASLREAIDALPELADQKEQLIELQRVRVRQAVEEIRLRFGAGQYGLAAAMMQSMPAAELPAEAMVELQVVNEEFEKRSAQIAEGTNLLRRLRETLTDDPMRKELEALFDQMQQELNPHTISRCAELLRSADNQAVSDEQRVALAISGWLTGEHASDSPSMARSLLRTRDAVREYLTTDSATRRAAIVEQLQSEEAGDPRHVSQILAAMAPPREHPPAKPFLAAPADADAEESERPPEPIPNLFEIELKGVSADQSIRYLVQLPPEYDPLRRYPAIVGLHPGGMPPLSQIEWWSGPYDQKLGMRLGQAARHGYIVIAPAWNRPKTVHYEYSAMEHAAVLFSLRDACHRFGVDTDRVFLCGHSTGGDAAWDIGLAHPDVWAGVILFGATSHQPAKSSPRYVTHYWPNAKMVPLYFVGGDKDSSRMEMNAQDFNAYLRKSGFDVMVVEYRGRGHESFSDEIQRLFRWMKIHRRDFHPKEIDVVTRRPCDNFFWFLETQGMNPRSMIGPFEWPQPRAALPFAVKASVREKSRVHLTTNAAEVTVYLAPEMVDFEGDVSILLRNRKRAKGIRPNLRVLLEDVRTRGDRLHPFWAKEVIQQ
jgi:predicted esterase